MEQRLPLITRLTLSALGAPRQGRVRAAVDPVAAWMLKRQPDLHPHGAAQAAFTTIRARTALVDRMIEDAVEDARGAGDRLTVWSLGPGFDARWYRLFPKLADTVRTVREVEEPTILQLKNALLEGSPYAAHWGRVVRKGQRRSDWQVESRRRSRVLVVMEGLAGRMEQPALAGLLGRIRQAAPDASVVLGLPGVGDDDMKRWSIGRLGHDGWKVLEDARLGSRGRLILATGGRECPGTYPLRVMRLQGRG